MLIEPYIPSDQEQHEDNLWVMSECYHFYAQQRRLHCNFLQIMDLWLSAPYCTECASSDPFEGNGIPDIVPESWEVDLSLSVGQNVLEQTQRALRQNPDFHFLCKKCGRELRPWVNSEIYVVSHHLEEHYGIPLQTPGQRNPRKSLRKQLIRLYDNRCFGCNSGERRLHIDHIRPKVADGDAAFRNLQPLCTPCGNRKGNQLPDEIEVYSTIYFGPYPSDGYERLFW